MRSRVNRHCAQDDFGEIWEGPENQERKCTVPVILSTVLKPSFLGVILDYGLDSVDILKGRNSRVEQA